MGLTQPIAIQPSRCASWVISPTIGELLDGELDAHVAARHELRQRGRVDPRLLQDGLIDGLGSRVKR